MAKRKKLPEPKRFCLYARVSTDEQAKKENASPAVQLEITRRYASQLGEVVATYVDDGITGTHLNRPQFQKMLDDAVTGLFDCVVITYMGRLARGDVFPVAEYLLHQAGVSIRATEEDFASNPDGVVMKAVTQMSDKLYIEQIRGYTCTKMREMVRQGYCVGFLPFGLKAQPTSDHETAPKIIVHDPEAGQAVRVSFEMFLESKSLASVRDFLSSVSNRKWTTTTAKALLQNRTYLGELRFGDWENLNAFPPLIPTEIFDAVQLNLNQRKRTRSPRNSDYEYLLRGLVHCPHCGCPYTNSMAKGGLVRYYECYSDKKRFTKCPVGRVNCEIIHQSVLDKLAHLVRHPVAMHEAIKQSKGWEIPAEHLVSQRVQLGKSLQVATTRQTNLLTAIEGGANISSVVERLKQVEIEIRELSERIREADGLVASATKLRPTARDVQESWSAILGAWGFASDDEKAALVRLVVERVDVNTKDRAELRLTSIVELPGLKFGISEKLGAGRGFEPLTSGL